MSIINESVLYSLLLSLGDSENAKPEANSFAKALVKSGLCEAARFWISDSFTSDNSETNEALNFVSFPETYSVQASVKFPILYEALLQDGFISNPSDTLFPIKLTGKDESSILFWLGDLGFLELIRNDSKKSFFSSRLKFDKDDYDKVVPVFEKLTKQLKNKLLREKKVSPDKNNSQIRNASDNFRNKYLHKKLVAALSHELRNPLNILLGYLDMLSATKLTQEQKEFCEVINESGQDLFITVKKVFQFVNLALNQVVFENLPFDLSLLFIKIEKYYRHMAQSKNLTLNLKVDPSLTMKLVGDMSKLTDILMYLLDNALKFTDIGKVTVEATKLFDNENDIILQFKVTDTGKGISDELDYDILDFFVQEDDSITRNYGGLGLGLSIANEYISRMGGELQLKSKKGAGTKVNFKLSFKKYKGNDYPVSDVLDIDMDIAGKIKVLVVDDDAYQREMVLRIMEGWNTYTAANGQDAIDFLRDHPDTEIVLMDIRMPVLDGISATRIIRNELKHKSLVFAVSGEVQEATIEECLEAGMDAFVSKPYNKDKLLRKIISKMQRSDLVRQSETKIFDPYRLDGLKALIVEDNIMNQQVTIRHMKNVGCIVDLAKDGASAVGFAEKNTYDFILLDMYLPDIDGLQLAPKIRVNQRDVCIIAYSGDDSDSIVEKCNEVQIRSLILKKYQKSSDLAYLINQALISHQGFIDENKQRMDSGSLYSLTQINDIVGGNSEDMKQIVEAFADYTTKLIETMVSLTHENKVEIKRTAHTLVSSAKQFQMTNIIPVLQKLENEQDHLSNEQIEGYLQQTVSYFSESIQQMVDEVLKKD
jgi:signal transduction histidine kinase/DNA-binding response OmpR family regulator/HPt (histidine-containing phosphotransfer) domain-containing protein